MNRRELAIALAALLRTNIAVRSASSNASSLAVGNATRSTMQHRPVNPSDNSYAQAHEVTDLARLLFVSGQVPADDEGKVPADFAAQCRLTWANVERQLHAGGMTLDNIVKVTTFLSDRRYRRENYEVRKAVLGPRQPAITILIAGIYDEAWLLEIEVVAAA